MKTLFRGTSLASRSYREQVMARELTGEALRPRFGEISALLQSSVTQQSFARASAFLRWHVAHCPIAADREAAANMLARTTEGFRQLSYLHAAAEITEAQAVDKLPLPFRQVRFGVDHRTAGWVGRVFPEARVDWPQTYLVGFTSNTLGPLVDIFIGKGILAGPRMLGEVSGMFIPAARSVGRRAQAEGVDTFTYVYGEVAEEEGPFPYLFADLSIPSYDSWQVTENVYQDAQAAYDLLRFSLSIRGRGLIGGGDDLLSFPQASTFSVEQASAGEEVFLLDLPPRQGGVAPRHSALFVKNGWPIGYGMAWLFSGIKKRLGLNFYIFPEFRGTVSSANVVRRLAKVAGERYEADRFWVERESREMAMGRFLIEEFDAYAVRELTLDLYEFSL